MTWRARGYWVLATVLLPLVNPLLLYVSTVVPSGTGDVPWIPPALVIGLVTGLLLWAIARRIWSDRDARRWRVALGVAAMLVLSVAFGIVELLVTIVIVCSDRVCFN